MKAREVVSLQDVMLHFDIVTDSAEFALNYWLRKGKIQLKTANCSSGGCSSGSCNSSKAPNIVGRKLFPCVFAARISDFDAQKYIITSKICLNFKLLINSSLFTRRTNVFYREHTPSAHKCKRASYN